MKIRKRDKIRLLFWLPFWTIVATVCGMVGWGATLIHLGRH
jgi:hypothetical protein